MLGKDERVRIDDTRSPPYCSVVRLDVTFPKTPAGSSHLCSGTLIGDDAVLTAAHCVVSSNYGGRATSVVATPGAFVGQTAGYREFGVMKDPAGHTLEMLAYHGDLCDTKKGVCSDGFAQYQCRGELRRVVSGNVGRHYLDMMPGASGAGMTGDGNDTDRLIAINVAQVDTAPAYNLAVMLTPAIVSTIQSWVKAP